MTDAEVPDAVVVKTKVGFMPFDVPDEVRLAIEVEPMTDRPTVKLDDLDDDVIDALASRWLDNLYASVKRRSPFYHGAQARAA